MLHWSLLQASSLLFTASPLQGRLEVFTLELLGQLVTLTQRRGLEQAASWVFLLATSLGQHRTNSWLSRYGCWRASCRGPAGKGGSCGPDLPTPLPAFPSELW